MYTLIAYRKEKEHWFQGNYVPSKLLRFDNLSREECVSMIVDLSIEIPEKPDMIFEEFQVIPIVWTKEICDFVETIKSDTNEIIKEERQKKFLHHLRACR